MNALKRLFRGQRAREEQRTHTWPKTRPQPAPRFTLLTVADVLTFPAPEWLVDGVIPSTALAQLYGESGVGKTFVALDLALCVATGRKWLGMYEVVHAPVVYVSAEGHRGMKARIEAWLEHHAMSQEEMGNFRLLAQALPLGNREDVEALVRLVRETFEDGKLGLVVLDTQARCTEGLDENSAKDMGLAVGAAEELKRSTHATMLLIHHTGYEQGHPRGSTSVKAAIDTLLKLSGHPTALTLECEKQKDSDEFEDVSLALLPVGDSLVAVSESDPSVRLALAEAALTPQRRAVLDTLRRFEDGLTATEWERESPGARSTFYESRTVLVDARLVTQDGDRYIAVPLTSTESNAPKSGSGRACSGGVRRSTTPLGGGLPDPDASDPEAPTDDGHDCGSREVAHAPR